jgi:DNA-binding NtrC family response regulator
MTSDPLSHRPRLVHPALDTAPSRSLAFTGAPGAPRLTDRRRVGLLLQGAALLAHLDSAGGRTARGWRGAGLGPEGELCGVEAVHGARRVLCQESLRELVELLFGSAERVAGRGAARRAVRRLLERWRPALAPLPPHRAVTEILEVAPFLWQPDHGVDRRALVAELVTNGTTGPNGLTRPGESIAVLVAGAGTGGWPRRVADDDPRALRELLEGEDARRLWRPADEPGDPAAPAASGRWREAVAAWAIRGATGAEERLAHGEALLADGRFAAAAEVLKEVEGARALAGHLRARLLLGELGPVRRRLARIPDDADLPSEPLVELADVAQRAFGNSRRPERGAAWIERALRETASGAEPQVAALAEVVAATAAWDRGDVEAMDRHLTAAKADGGSPEVAWRRLQAEGLRALAEGDGPAMVESLSRALATARRSLRRDQAGGLWSDLGVGRARVGDLAGAERAFLHAHRLLGACDGPKSTTLALHNLAEIRLRRGHLAGVEGILAGALEENRLAGNVRGQIHDLALLARHELVLGRPRSALAHCGEARELQAVADGWYRDELSLLEARALGWLGRPAEAADALSGIGSEIAPEALGELEPEERPALFALAGLPERARRWLDRAPDEPDGPAALWRAALDGEAAPGPLWRALDGLEPYRAARTVHDLELVRPGIAPASWRRRAVAVFRRIGAAAFAEHLELSDGGAWTALGRYLAPARDGGGGLPALRRLFEEAGFPEVRIERWSDEHPTGPEVLIGGEGGDEELSAPDRRGGRLVLRAATLDATVRALCALAVREIAGGRAPAFETPGPRPDRAAERATGRGGIVGESPALRAAVERAGLLSAGDLPILVRGESGTGKELIARLVHRESRRRGELVAVNCAALSENLLLSDLFGHVRGAFTGADRDRAGVFESAAGGTVFLDEIGDLPLAAQGTLLRVLQEGEVRRLGESLPRKVDARLVAATHRDLRQMVDSGRFRGDLFFRLSVARVELPPLREREGDALRIADALLAELAPGARLSAAARSRLAAHPWPGNVRELKNVLEVAVALSGSGSEGVRELGPEHLELAGSAGEEPMPEGDYHAQVEAYRIRLLRKALEASGGNQAEAARRLGVSRQNLSYMIKKLRLV